MLRIANIRIGTKLVVMSVLSVVLVGGVVWSQRFGNASVRDAIDIANAQQQIGRDLLAAKGEVTRLQLTVREILLARTSDDLTKAMKAVQDQNKRFHNLIDPLIKRLDDAQSRAQAEKLGKLADEYVARTLNEVVATKSEAVDSDIKNADEAQRMATFDAEAFDVARTRTLPVAVELDKVGDQIIVSVNGLVKREIVKSGSVMQAAESVGLVIGAAAAVLMMGLAVLGRASIVRPLVALTGPINELAGGNFNVAVSGVGRKDEVGQIATAVNAMAARVKETIAEIKQSAMEVSNASGEISTSTTDLSQRTEEQAASLEETTAAMEEFSLAIKKSAQNAELANTSAGQARKVADEGGQIVSRTVDAMAKIEESSRKISDIIGVIDEIARQTNLLALNAAVEAARAGEAGRGFAVVATEVRSLAQRASQAAKDIKELITNSNGQVTEGVELVNHAGEALAKIVESVKDVATLVSDIATASSEQATGLQQINRALNQMDEMTQRNAALVEENAATAKALEAQAQAMDERVSFFKVDDGVRATPIMQVATEAAAAVKQEPAAAPAPQATARPARKAAPVASPVGRMRTALAIALDVEQERKDF